MVVLKHTILEWLITTDRYLGLLFRKVTPNLEIRKKVTEVPFLCCNKNIVYDNLKFL